MKGLRMMGIRIEHVASVLTEASSMLKKPVEEILRDNPPEEEYQKQVVSAFAPHLEMTLHEFMIWYVKTLPKGPLEEMINWHFKGPNYFEILLSVYEYVLLYY